MTRHRMIEPPTSQPGKTNRFSNRAKNGRKSVKVESTPTNGANTPSKPFDPPKAKPKAKNAPSELLESMQTSDHDSVAGLSSNGNLSILEGIKATYAPHRIIQPQPVKPEPEEDWHDRVVRLYPHDPYGCVLTALELKLLPWQEDILNDASTSLAIDPTRFWHAIASGKGVGKTYLMAALFVWHVITHPDSQTCMTASSGRQTDTRVWKEVKKLVRSTNVHKYFKVDNTKLVHNKIDTWSGFTQAWNEERPEAFQGLHAKYLAIFVDEASGVPDDILETIESGCTDEHTFLAYYSNPTKPDGRFKECFPGGLYHEGWKTYHIDATTVSIVSERSIAKRLSDAHGNEDDDGYRINVLGQFPKLEGQYFISEAMIKAAQERQYIHDDTVPYVMGCDISGGGMSASVAIIRQGDRLVERHVFKGMEEVAFAGFVATIIKKYDQEGNKLHTFIESVSYGRATISLLKEQGFKRIYPVHIGLDANNTLEYYNKRAEIADEMKKWIMNDACLEKQEKWENLYAQLIKVKAQWDSKGRLKMEDKYGMLRREGGLCDEADALATTFDHYIPRSIPNSIPPPEPIPINGSRRGMWRQTFTG